MVGTRSRLIFSQLYTLAGAAPPPELSDGQLLERFIASRDEAAFGALLQRHGSMVLRVCRRALHQPQDAEDAFQATFLLLAQKAASIQKHESVASWLYGVAYRLAIKARARSSRRQAREKRAVDIRHNQAGLQASWQELQTVLDEELHRLPARHQVPLVLCYLEGKTHEEAARQLGCPVGTVHSRVTRAREMLRKRLARRGLTLSVAALATVLAADVAAGVPARLLGSTCSAALAHAAGDTIPAGLVTAEAAALTKGGLAAMTATQLKLGMALLVAFGLVAAGAGAMFGGLSTTAAPPPAVSGDAPKQGEPAAPRLDIYGQPLPPEAVTRLGNVRQWPTIAASGATLTFTSDSKHLAHSGPDRAIVIWDAISGKETARIAAADKPGPVPLALIFSPDDRRVAVFENNAHIRVWDIKANKELAHLSNLSAGFIHRGAFSPDGKMLIAPGHDGLIHRWDTASWEKLPAFEGHKGAVNSAAFSTDGKRIVSAGDDQTVKLWEAASGKLLHSKLKHRNQVVVAAFSADGKRIASWGNDSEIRVWDAETGADVRSWRFVMEYGSLGGNNPTYLQFSPDGKSLSYGDSMLAGIRTVDLSNGAQVGQFATAGPAFQALSPDGKLLAAGGSNQGPLRVIDTATGKELPRWGGGHQGVILAMVFSSDGKTLATASKDRTVRLWDAATGKELHKLTGHAGAVSHLCFSRDGKYLASASAETSDKTVSWWDVASGKELRQFPGHAPAIRALDVMPDGKRLLVLTQGGHLHVWNTETGEKIREELRPRLGSATFAPDGKHVVFSELGGQLMLRVWDLTKEGDGAIRDFPTGPGRLGFPAVAFSPDGLRMVAPVTNEKMILWEFPSGKVLRSVERTEGLIRSFPWTQAAVGALSADSHTLAIPYKGGGVALIELATGKMRHLFRGQQGIVTALAFSPDGATLVSGGDDGSALVWEIKPTGQGKTELTAEQRDALWANLADADAVKAYQAVRTLAGAPKQAIALFQQIRPVAPTGLKEVGQHIKNLAASDFQVRKKAEEALAKLGHKAAPALKKALEDMPELDVVQRLERLLAALDDRPLKPDELRVVRAVEVLEAAGTEEARKLLQEWAKGATAAVLTEEAKASLVRLGSQ
jgi:RNA polymerase sigma factor (sigma-70 family)